MQYEVPARASLSGLWERLAARTDANTCHQERARRLRIRRSRRVGCLALSNQLPSDPLKRSTGRCRRQAAVGSADLEEQRAAPVSFAYLFEPRDEQGRYWSGANDIPFVIAEAIFVVTASGMSVSAEYEGSLRRNIPSRHAPSRGSAWAALQTVASRSREVMSSATVRANSGMRLLKLLADRKNAVDDATLQRWDAEEMRRVAA